MSERLWEILEKHRLSVHRPVAPNCPNPEHIGSGACPECPEPVCRKCGFEWPCPAEEKASWDAFNDWGF